MYCDLHAHSIFSDGTSTPEELLAMAEACGLAAVALTDHNTVSGLPRFMQAGAGRKISPVPGIELSTAFEGTEVHMLGLFLPEESWPMLQRKMNEVLSGKEESNRRLVAALRREGVDVDYDVLAGATPDGRINRAHIGAAMVEKGYVKSIGEAMTGLLSEKKGLYRPPRRLDVMEGIDLIRQAGGVPVLAHPFLNLTEEELHLFLPLARQAGLAGMETRYSLYDENITALARQMAEKYGLLESGGSDFHGAYKPDIALGKGKGRLRIPLSFYEKLKNRA